MFNKILVPVDGSGNADRAVRGAIELAQHNDASLFLVHVIRPWALPKEILDMISAGEVTVSRLEIMQDSAKLILDSAKKLCSEAGVSVLKAEFVTGDPAKMIAEFAAAHAVDLIVLGHSGLEAGDHPQMLGGVARKLLNITTVSCLVIR